MEPTEVSTIITKLVTDHARQSGTNHDEYRLFVALITARRELGDGVADLQPVISTSSAPFQHGLQD